MSKDVASHVGFDLQVLNFGGGFGVPYADNDQPLDIQRLGIQIYNMLGNIFPNETIRPSFYIELGRYLLAECGIFLVEILDVKKSRGKQKSTEPLQYS